MISTSKSVLYTLSLLSGLSCIDAKSGGSVRVSTGGGVRSYVGGSSYRGSTYAYYGQTGDNSGGSCDSTCITVIVVLGVTFLAFMSGLGFYCWKKRSRALTATVGPMVARSNAVTTSLTSAARAGRDYVTHHPAVQTELQTEHLRDISIQGAAFAYKFDHEATIHLYRETNRGKILISSDGQVLDFMPFQNDDTSIQTNYVIPTSPIPEILPPAYSSTATEGMADRSLLAVPANHTVLFYYETTIVYQEPRTCIAIGYASSQYAPFRLPGWNQYSVAVHGDNGNKFVNDDSGGQPFMSNGFRQGDTVGCGMIYNRHFQTRPGQDELPQYADYLKDCVFYTLNGSFVGIAFTAIRFRGLKPTLGSDGKCRLDVNFGRREFKWEPTQSQLVSELGLHDQLDKIAVTPLRAKYEKIN